MTANKTAIEWTDTTWNPVTGCDRVSLGCDHCYAATLARRLKAMGNPRYQNDGKPPTSGPGFAVTLHEDKIQEPLRWRSPRRVFVNSMSDLFHPRVTDQFIEDCFRVMVEAEIHHFQVLTKRPKRMASLLPQIWGSLGVDPPFNIWLGTSIENQEFALRRLPSLLETPAKVRFVSCEPLLDAVDLTQFLGPDPGQPESRLHWVIVGGESGPNHRPFELEWARRLRDQCVSRGVAYFFKQVGGHTPKAGGRELDGRTWDEMPSVRWRY